MRNDSSDRTTLLYRLTRRFETLLHPGELLAKELLDEPVARNLLAVKGRWIILALSVAYGVAAWGMYRFSGEPFFLSHAEISVVGAIVAFMACYNLMLQQFGGRHRFPQEAALAALFLDLAAATAITHLTGGAASWFWPVYLIISIEAVFLLDDPAKSIAFATSASLLFGLLLVAEHNGTVPAVVVPSSPGWAERRPLFLVLIWLWVTVLNGVAAVIGGFLMETLRRNHRALREHEERLVNFLESAHDLIQCSSPSGDFLYVNRAWQQTMGYALDDLSYLSFLDIVHEGDRAHSRSDLQKVLAGDRITFETGLLSKGGRTVNVEGSVTCCFRNGKPAEVWSICRDVTEKKQIREQLHFMAHHDILTGLPNRMLFMDRLKQARAVSHRFNSMTAVMFIDLDRLKVINDTLGHPVGDRILQEIAARISSCIREVDTVARFGGDEFVVILMNMGSDADIEGVAVKILENLSRPVPIDDQELFVTASIGIAVCPRDGDDPATLVKKADVAMYDCKGAGRNSFHFYREEMDLDAERKLHLGSTMRKGIESGDFRVFYQPKVDVASGKIVALEALARWQHPDFGLLAPAEFIPLAEENGLIMQLGEWVLRSACARTRSWQDQGFPPVRIAVNISGVQLQHRKFPELIREVLEETGLKPSSLELEITETVIMQNPDFTVKALADLRATGVHISIDDFGTGYSSLSHLKQFSVDTLKIDKSFLRDVEVNATDAAIATAIIAMGNIMKLRVVAEGVETAGQLEFLRESRCDEMQGFLVSRPLPEEEVARLFEVDSRFLPGDGLTCPVPAAAV